MMLRSQSKILRKDHNKKCAKKRAKKVVIALILTFSQITSIQLRKIQAKGEGIGIKIYSSHTKIRSSVIASEAKQSSLRALIGNSFYETFSDFKDSIKNFFKKTLKTKKEEWLMPIINDEFQYFDGHLIS